MKKELLLISILIFIMFISCTKTGKFNNTNSMIDKLCEDYYEEYLHFFPLEGTMQGDNRYNDQLPIDISSKFLTDLKAFCEKYLDKLKAIDPDNLSAADRINYDVLKETITVMHEGFKFHNEYLPINQYWSLTLTLPQLGSGKGIQPFKTVKDYNDFLRRVEKFGIWCDTAIANMQVGMKAGFVNPKALMVKTLPQIKDMIVDTPEKSIFYQPIANFPERFSENEKDLLRKEYTLAIKNIIVPSYKKLYDFIKNTYIPACRNTSGFTWLPGGKEMYRYYIKYYTGIEFSPDSVYNTGIKEVARIRREMEIIKDQVGFNGDLNAFFDFTTNNKQFKPFHSANEIIDYYRGLPELMKPHLKEMFNLVPKTKFEVRETEKFREASASAEYMPGSADETRPGIFYVPVLNPQEYNRLTMQSTFLHEAIPGHHYQISIQQEIKNLPRFRKFGGNGAYIEGWALYCEGLGKELGLYTDPYDYFGRLTNEAHRAIRLVVDVGLHDKGWTREEAIKYMMDNESISEAEATAEIERYMAIPGQALSYKIGELKILELKHRAQKELGNKFKISDFHDQILDEGWLPLSILEKKIDKWIQKEKENE